MNLRRLSLASLAAATALAAVSSFAADSVKIAVIDPLSGPFEIGRAHV